jgi:hypothetical protein
VSDLSGTDLGDLIRRSIPELDIEAFDKMLRPPPGLPEVQVFKEPSPKHAPGVDMVINWRATSRCGALMALADQVLDWVRAGRAEPVRQALVLTERLLAESPPAPMTLREHLLDPEQMHNSVLACFLETVIYLSKPAELRTLVVPYLGPTIRAHLEQYDPWALREPYHSDPEPKKLKKRKRPRPMR